MRLKERRIAILATNGVDAVELSVVRRRLNAEGAKTTLIAPTREPIKTWSNKQWRRRVKVDEVLEHANPSQFDGVFLPGGLLNSDKMRTIPDVITFLKDAYARGLPIAAICHAPWLLIDSGIAKGKTITSYHSLKVDLENAGARWVDEPFVLDGKVLTSRRPDDAAVFAEQVVNLFE